VERASEMAHHRTVIDYIINLPFDQWYKESDIYVFDEEGNSTYKDSIQDVFNFYYDEYFEQLVNNYEMPIL
jgi:hypothetical protein